MSGSPPKLGGLSVRILATFVIGWFFIICFEIAEDQKLISEVHESVFRLIVWAFLGTWLLVFTFRAKVQRAAWVGMLLFVSASTCGYALALTEDIESLRHAPIVGTRGFLHRPAERIVYGVASCSVAFLFFGLLAQLARTQKELEKRVEDMQLTQYAIDRATDCAFWVRPDGRFYYVNESACRTLGYTRDELLSLTVQDVDPIVAEGDEWERRWADKRASGSWTFESIHRRKNGELFPVEISSNYVVIDGQEYHCSLARDVSELRAVENESRHHLSQLAHVTRVHSMGELATGLAHELNQPLGSIANLTYLQQQALERNGSFDEIRTLSKRISDQVFRASDFIRRMRSLTKPTESSRSPVQLNEAVRSVLELNGADLRVSEIQLQEALAPTMHEIWGDKIQIQQVVINLLRNAIDSVSELEGHRQISVSTEMDGEYATFTVKDNGTGLEPDEMPRIFEAFHTSKDEGMGMGLAISRTIVESHGGRITANNNENGSGCSFTVRLPAA